MNILTPSVPGRPRRVRRGGRHRIKRRSWPSLRALAGLYLLVVALGLATGSDNALVPSGAEPPPAGAANQGGRSAIAAAGEQLMAQNDCWSGEAPPEWAGVLPAAAVVIPAGSDEPVHGSQWVGPALEHVFEGKRPRLTVLGFCPG